MPRRLHRLSDGGIPSRGGIASGRGFSIVEIMVALTIISLLVAAAIPQVKKYQVNSRAAVVASDLRTFAAAFESYSQEKGAWPAETDAGALPPEMTERLGASSWGRVTPMGGRYNWENNQMHGGVRYRAALSISEAEGAPLEVNEDLLRAIDRIIDDGNLSTGLFRTGVNNDPLYILLQ
ncbi:MAG: prepilin-type N-terminal cleavage/methylation domain-containing protein [Verrucomicrobia bacterium]|jgi:prepilin-type N-terminal cleavage/methylation domain-containing protein|nr:prepilin-type N-terminal cleavage/methylation domain-containing protein [Verrucomicrobiota bacterium]